MAASVVSGCATSAGRRSFEKPPRVNPDSLQLFSDFKDSLRPNIPPAVEGLGEFLAGRATQMTPQDEFVSLSTATFQFFKYVFDFHNLKEKDILMAMGGTGSGKSTTQAHLRGCQVKRVSTEREVNGRKVKRPTYMVDSPHVGHSLVGSATYEPHVHIPTEIEPFGQVTLVDFPGFSDSRSNAFNFGYLSAYKYFNRHAKSCRVVCCTTSIYKDREHLKGEMKKLLAMVLCTRDDSPYARLFVSLNYPSNDDIDMDDICAVQPSLTENKIGFGRLALNNLEFEPPLKRSLGEWLLQEGTCTPKAIMTGDPRTEAHAIFLKEDEKSHMAEMVNELLLGGQIKAFLAALVPTEKLPAVDELATKTQAGFNNLSVAVLEKHVESVTKAFHARSARWHLISQRLRDRRQNDCDEHGAVKTLAVHDKKWFPNLAPLVHMDIPEVLLAAIDAERNRIWNPCSKLLTDETRKQLTSTRELLERPDIADSCKFLGLTEELTKLKERLTKSEDLLKDREDVQSQIGPKFLELEKMEIFMIGGASLAVAWFLPAAMFAGAVTALCAAVGGGAGAALNYSRHLAKEPLKNSLRNCLDEILESIGTLEKTTSVVDAQVKGLENLQRTLQAVIKVPHDHASKCQLVEE